MTHAYDVYNASTRPLITTASHDFDGVSIVRAAEASVKRTSEIKEIDCETVSWALLVGCRIVLPSPYTGKGKEHPMKSVGGVFISLP